MRFTLFGIKRAFAAALITLAIIGCGPASSTSEEIQPVTVNSEANSSTEENSGDYIAK